MDHFSFLRELGLTSAGAEGKKPVETLFEKQRRELDVRKAFVCRVRENGARGIDPVLRSHLGLDELSRK